MNRTKQIKAVFLLVVFSLHTLVGLACSVGFNVGLRDPHHPVETASHSHEKPHLHKAGVQHAHDHGHVTGKEHSHDASVPPHEHSSTNTHEDPERQEDCCTDAVVKISLLDKALTSEHAHILLPSVPLAFTLYAFFLNTYATNDFSLLKLKPPNPRSWPLATHTDLRIAIQSFQI